MVTLQTMTNGKDLTLRFKDVFNWIRLRPIIVTSDFWLAPATKQRLLFVHAVARTVSITTINELLLRKSYTDAEILHIGAVVHEALRAAAPPWAPSAWLASFLDGTPVNDALPSYPNSQSGDPESSAVVDYDTLLHAVLGGAVLIYARSPLTNPVDEPYPEELAEAVSIGVHLGIRTLARIKSDQADRFRKFAEGVMRGLSKHHEGHGGPSGTRRATI